MKITDSMPFAAELLAPSFETCQRAGAPAGAGEVQVGPDWTLVVAGDSVLERTAAEHLTGFLAAGLGLQLAASGKAIRLVVAPELGDNAETHRLRVTADGIEVAGAGPAGVLQGVFRLEARMKERGAPIVALGEETREPLFRHRIHRSPFSPFYVEELTGYDGPPLDARWFSPGMEYPGYAEEDAGPDLFYHDNLMIRLAEHGFNGFWLRGALRLFARVDVFPEWGVDSDRILERLRRLTERAGRYGLKVFLYFNEPMGMRADDPFWQAHPQVRGSLAPYAPMTYLCPSTPEVQSYLRDGMKYVFEQVPELSGVLLISASEFPHHCYSHTLRPDDPAERAKMIAEDKLCPRCAERIPQEVVASVVNLIRDGVKAAKPSAEVIAWNWSWNRYEPDPQRGVLERLADDVIVMGDYERGEPAEACGVAYENDEYSIKVVGPSRRFRGVAEFQAERNLPVYAKLQLGTTHENPSIPYLPVPQKIAQKYHTLRETGVSGMMTCWNFGNMPSLGTEIAGEFSWAPQPSVTAGLRAIAARHFGDAVADEVVAGWQQLCDAHEAFPSSIPVMYNGPVSRGPAFWFVFERIDHKFPNSWLLDKELAGDLLNWTHPFTPEHVLHCYRTEAAGLAEGIATLESALAETTGRDHERLAREIGLAKFHRHQTVSAANVVDFLLTRNAYYDEADAAAKLTLLERLEAIVRAEEDNATAALPLCDADARLGWHGEAYGYMINRPLIEDKLARLAKLLDEALPAARRSVAAVK